MARHSLPHRSDALDSFCDILQEAKEKDFDRGEDFVFIKMQLINYLVAGRGQRKAQARANFQIKFPDNSVSSVHVGLLPSTFSFTAADEALLKKTKSVDTFLKRLRPLFINVSKLNERAGLGSETKGKNRKRKATPNVEARIEADAEAKKAKTMVRIRKKNLEAPISASDAEQAKTSICAEETILHETKFIKCDSETEMGERSSSEARLTSEPTEAPGTALGFDHQAAFEPLDVAQYAGQNILDGPVQAAPVQAQQSELEAQFNHHEDTSPYAICEGAEERPDSLAGKSPAESMMRDTAMQSDIDQHSLGSGQEQYSTIVNLMHDISTITPENWEEFKPKLLEHLAYAQIKSADVAIQLPSNFADSAVERLRIAISHLGDEISQIPPENWNTYEKELEAFCTAKGSLAVGFPARLAKITRICYLGEESDAMKHGNWDKLNNVVRLCAVLAEMTGPSYEVLDREAVNEWVRSKFRDIAWLKKLVGAKTAMSGIQVPGEQSAEG